MAARVIHFGWDDCYRVPVLRAAGFEVEEAKSLGELGVDLQRKQAVDAVIVSEELEPTAELVAERVRKAVPVPVILFRRSQREIDERKFEKVYTCTTPPDVWLSEMAALIAKGYKLQAEAAHLREEAAEVQAETRRQRMRAHGLREKLPPIPKWRI